MIRYLALSILGFVSFEAAEAATQKVYSLQATSEYHSVRNDGEIVVHFRASYEKARRSRETACELRSFTYTGMAGGFDCSKLDRQCDMGPIQLRAGKLRVDVHGTIPVGEGMDNRKIAEMELAEVDRNGVIQWNKELELDAKYVEARHNFVEKLLGATDANFCALTISQK